MAEADIVRYPKALNPWSFEKAPANVCPELVTLEAGDGAKSKATLYATGKENTVILMMHPRQDMSRHYAVPSFVANGYAFFAQVVRSPGDDITAHTIHEHLLADVAAGVKFLRGKGFENIIMLGNSGAAALFSYYQSQAVTPPPGRLTTTAAGDPFDLNAIEMDSADGYIFLGPHLGAGIWNQENMDPSVIDEADPTSCDPSLDAFNPANGFREPPEPSVYSDEFIAKYRKGQADRAARIDAKAWAIIHEQRTRAALARTEMAVSPETARFVEREAIAASTQRLTVYRLDADLISVDQSTTLPDRTYGSLFSKKPNLSNYSTFKSLDPRVWLSSWSAAYSRADLLSNLAAVTQPTLVIGYRGDNAVLPETVQFVYDKSPAANKHLELLPGDHFGYFGETGGKAADKAIQWLKKNFPPKV